MNLLRMTTGIPSRRGIVLPSSIHHHRRPMMMPMASVTTSMMMMDGGGSSSSSGDPTKTITTTTTTTTTTTRTTTTTTRFYGSSSKNHKDNDDHKPLGLNLHDLRNLESIPEASARGQEALRLLPSYLADARAIPIHSASQPDAPLQLGVAETKMVEDLLLPVLNDGMSDVEAQLPANAIYYQPTAGRVDVKAAMVEYLHEIVGRDVHLQSDNLVIGAGCNAVLENLCFCVADPNDTVLIPTPYYAAFEFDLGARANLRVQGVDCAPFHEPVTEDGMVEALSSSYYPNLAALDAAYDVCVTETGRPPRVLLISHPMNPLGICYPKYVVEECIDWCRERQVHFISDEIYAGSVYNNVGKDGEKIFTSALEAAGPTLGPFVHWVYALSKDFGLSGMRVGVVYTENEPVLMALQKLNDLCQVSSQTQLWTKRLLEYTVPGTGERWTQSFRRENHARLRSRSIQITNILDQYHVPYLPPTAGLFVWLDLSKFLANVSPLAHDPERALYMKLILTYGLLLTPGASMRHNRPAFFRLVFTAATDAEFALALVRLENLLRTETELLSSSPSSSSRSSTSSSSSSDGSTTTVEWHEV